MDKTEEEAREEIRLKILNEQEIASRKPAGDNKSQAHHVNKEEPKPLDERLRVDQIQSQQGRISSVAPVAGSSIRGVSAKMDPSNFVDALEQWRYMSEKYRDKRLGKDKDTKLHVPVKSSVKTTFDETGFQKKYENDSFQISGENEAKQNIERENALKQLSSANVDVDPDLLVEPDSYEVIPTTNLLTVSEVMTKDVISVIDSMTIEQVASIFNKKKITGIPVVHYQTKELTGIITMSDIISNLFESSATFSLHEESRTFQPGNLSIMEKKVSDLMQRNVIQVSADKTVKEACNLMIENQIQEILVTQNNRIKGIFTSFDAVKILAKYDIKTDLEILW